jgi:hypothetical protein
VVTKQTQLSAAALGLAGCALLVSVVSIMLGGSVDRRSKQTSMVVDVALRGRQQCEARLDAFKVTIDKLVDADGELHKKLRLATKDRDVAFLLLEDVRIAIGAIAATQKGRFRAPYIAPRKRP